MANQLAYYLTASMQLAWRRMRGVEISEMAMVTRMHARHLEHALRLKQ